MVTRVAEEDSISNHFDCIKLSSETRIGWTLKMNLLLSPGDGNQ